MKVFGQENASAYSLQVREATQDDIDWAKDTGGYVPSVSNVIQPEEIVIEKPHTLEMKTQRILDFIINYKINTDGNSPAVREILNGLNLSSTSVVIHYLRILENLGIIERKNEINKTTVHFCVVGGKWSPRE